MNPEERVSQPGEPASRAVGTSHGPSAREADDLTTTEQATDVEAAREALAETEAGTATVPVDQVRTDLTPDLANGTDQEPWVQ